jgi:microcystin-dependent protein
MDGVMGEIRFWPGSSVPVNWLPCDGRRLSIEDHSALYSILTTTYGGDGLTEFQLPDLRGRVPVGLGQGPQLPYAPLGLQAGRETETVTVAQMPKHNHTLGAGIEVTGVSLLSPGERYPGPSHAPPIYGDNRDGHMASDIVEETGGGESHENMMPYLVVGYIICVAGMYPMRG